MPVWSSVLAPYHHATGVPGGVHAPLELLCETELLEDDVLVELEELLELLKEALVELEELLELLKEALVELEELLEEVLVLVELLELVAWVPGLLAMISARS